VHIKAGQDMSSFMQKQYSTKVTNCKASKPLAIFTDNADIAKTTIVVQDRVNTDGAWIAVANGNGDVK
jgi:hypothetical protein